MMTFMEAKAAIKDLAAGEFHSVQFELAEYSNGSVKHICRAYIGKGTFWTEGHATWEAVIEEAKQRIEQKEAAVDIATIAPE